MAHPVPQSSRCRCDICPYAKDKKPNRPVLAVGLHALDRVYGVVIGESPSAEEVSQNRPFSGMTGRELDDIFERNKLDRSRLVVLNAIACRPKEPKDDNDMEHATKCCRPYVAAVLREVENGTKGGAETPILMMGKCAYLSVTGKAGYIDERGFIQGRVNTATIRDVLLRSEQDHHG